MKYQACLVEIKLPKIHSHEIEIPFDRETAMFLGRSRRYHSWKVIKLFLCILVRRLNKEKRVTRNVNIGNLEV